MTPSWTEFDLSSNTHVYGAPHPITDSSLGLKAPALSVPAILSFISILSHLHERKDYSPPLIPSRAPPPTSKLLSSIGNEWECEWGRSANLGTVKLPGDEKFRDSFRPGRYVVLFTGLHKSNISLPSLPAWKVYGREYSQSVLSFYPRCSL